MTNLNEIISKCNQYKISVYMVVKNEKWFVEVSENGKKKRFEKIVAYGKKITSSKAKEQKKEWEIAIEKTWKFYYDKIRKYEIDKRSNNK